jgi:hypothetical protein
MEDQMCWEIDYLFLAQQNLAQQKKAQQARAEQEQRDGVIKSLLNAANKQADDTTTETPEVREAAPAK